MPIEMNGAQARNFMAAALVDQYGRRALDKCCGPMLVAVERELASRALPRRLAPPSFCCPALQSEAMTYTTNPRNVLPNGLTLLQQNPDCAAKLDPTAKDHGWLYRRGADGQWVTLRKLSDAELETAYDQAADMAVLQGTQVRAG